MLNADAWCLKVIDKIQPSFNIGKLKIDKPVMMAPMVGLTHIAFRQVVVSLGGCGIFYSEMLSARRILDDIKRNNVNLMRLSNERPFFYQLVGNDPIEFAKAINALEEYKDEAGNPPDGIDINLGCSAPLIRKNKMGAGLLGDQALVQKILSACRKSTQLPLTVKMRLGENDNFEDLFHLCLAMINEGVDAITLHPRLTKERFTRRARWKHINELQRNITIPVIGNGDINTILDINLRFQEAGCRGIMIGRGAIMKPWIFRDVCNGVEGAVSKKEVYYELINNLKKYYAPDDQIRLLKIFTTYYSRNFMFGHMFNAKIFHAPDINKAEEVAAIFFEKN